MYKLLSELSLSLYSDVFVNTNWLEKYEKLDLFQKRSIEILNSFLSSNKSNCILYGSKCTELHLQTKNQSFKMNISDYDIFSSKPKQHINELYKQFIKEPYVWSASCSFAKNHGTCTLYINEKKIVDITYMNQQTIELHPFIELSNIRCLPYTMQMSSLTSLLSDIESVYMIPKTVDKLRLLITRYPFKFDNSILSHVNILEHDSVAKLILRISSAFNKFKQSDFIKIPKIFDLKEGRVFIENDEIKHTNNYIQFNEYDTNATELESIHPISGFPSFRRYTQPSLHRYFFTGSLAAYLYISAFGDNIQIGNSHIPKIF